MNEKNNKKAVAKEKKKDMYTAVLISQIVGVIILMLTFSLTVKNNESAYASLKDLLSEEKFTLGDMVSAVKGYLSADNSWAVFGDNVSFVYDESKDSATQEQATEPSAQERATEESATKVKSTEETASEEVSSEEKLSQEVSSEKISQELLTGSGGEDLELYEAADNASFAPIRSTSPAISPIEKGRYTSYFGYRISPITGEFSFHTGLDIAAEEGTKIRAALNGRVLRIGEDSRAGKYIFLEHDEGFVTFYCHCSEIIAEEGANIRQGETIAKVGSTGWSTGPHLHFEVRKNNIRFNPLYILDYDSYYK